MDVPAKTNPKLDVHHLRSTSTAGFLTREDPMFSVLCPKSFNTASFSAMAMQLQERIPEKL